MVTSVAQLEAAANDTPPSDATHRPTMRTRRDDDGRESLDVWGFDDTRFVVNDAGEVELTGSRYALAGQRLPHLLPWVERTMGVSIPLGERFVPKYPPAIAASKLSTALREALVACLGKTFVCEDAEVRLRHGHGHTQAEMYAIKYDSLARVPDAVVFPDSEADVVSLVALAKRHNAVLMPYGGGTNVTLALAIDPSEKRAVIAVDMQRMDRILWLDRANRMACIEAGAVGRHLQASLAGEGLTIGHEPDSIEFSTLGGWVATNASGMKKNRYGNIEDLVLDISVVTSDGVVRRSVAPPPRESTGVDVRQLFFGSEGALGIITSVVVKLQPLPESQSYGSLLFPSFGEGVEFLHALQQTGDVPASVRLVDNTQFQLSMALKPKRQGLQALKGRAEAFVVQQLKGFDAGTMCAATLVFEGSVRAVAAQKKQVIALARRHRGMWGGESNGAKGYQLTYGIAYIRDFVLNHFILAESFETSVPWSHVLELCERVKRRIAREHAERKLPGRPLVTCRVTQLYDTGVAVYFYLAYFFRGVEDPSHVYHELEEAARDEILLAHGSLSHHHGVGALRRKFLDRIASAPTQALRTGIKHALDPQRMFGSGQGALHG